MADLNDTQTADLFGEGVAAMPPTPSEGKTKRARARGTDTQATRTACAQPALEMWQQYTPAPIDHPAIMQHGVLVDDARVIPAGADMPFSDDGIDWLALPLTNPKGEVVSLAYLHPEPNQKPRYFDGYAKGAYVPIKPQRGQVVHVVSNPQDGSKTGECCGLLELLRWCASRRTTGARQTYPIPLVIASRTNPKAAIWRMWHAHG